MLTFRELQGQVSEWANKNFGTRLRDMGELGKDEDRPPWHPLLGVSEEAGELCHAYLKMVQKIRGDDKQHIEEAKDAVGDILIYLADFCALMDFDMQEIAEETWELVQKRNWEKNNKTGK
jgi:NTP pyrophosphatase (non-canonical NTP hydrolase)